MINKEIIRYLIATPLVGLTDLGIYYLLIRFLPHSFAKAVSYVIANVTGYLFNKFWVFKRKQKQPLVKETGRYVAADILLFGCNVLTNQAVLFMWPHAVLRAVVAASVWTTILSFILKKWWVFKTSPTAA